MRLRQCKDCGIVFKTVMKKARFCDDCRCRRKLELRVRRSNKVSQIKI